LACDYWRLPAAKSCFWHGAAAGAALVPNNLHMVYGSSLSKNSLAAAAATHAAASTQQFSLCGLQPGHGVWLQA
jgi:hypothetical protein